MKIELRKHLYYYEEGYEPSSKHIRSYPIESHGNGSNRGWIILETEEEKDLFDNILQQCGVANSNNLDRLIIDLFISTFNIPIWILKGIDKLAKNKKIPEGIIKEDDRGFFHVEEDDFCHHSFEEAAYWYNLENITPDEVENNYFNL